MAPFRSSRSTRNNDPATLNRGRGGAIDHDPTEGLPVRNWYLGNINIKQDEPAATDDDQQPSANTTNPDYPWPELRLPSFYSELPALSQQIVRAARSGRPVKPSVYDKKTGTYISHAEYATRNTLKSKHLENVNSPAAEDDDDMDEDVDVKVEMEKQERAFALRKWAQVPWQSQIGGWSQSILQIADQAAVLNPALNANATGAAAAGLDLGDGSGLGNATGVLAAGADRPPMALTPAKRMPPKRKKKGGPGRKKANLGPGPLNPNGPLGAQSALSGGVAVSGDAIQPSDAVEGGGDTHMEEALDGEDDKGDEGSGSDEEGSEEGEIEEHHPHDTEMRLEDNEEKPATEPVLLEVPPVPVIIAQLPVAELQPPVPATIEPAEPGLMPATVIEELNTLPDSVLDPALLEPITELVVPELVAEPVVSEPVSAPVPPAPAEASGTTVDFLKSLNDSVADQERRGE